MMDRRKQLRSRAGWVVLGLLLVFAILRNGDEGGIDGDVDLLFREQRSGEMVEFAGEVSRVLADDLDGSRHQRFVVRLESGHTVLVSHNIDLAARLENLARGDEIAVRGQYEWNDRGGVVHWTHHDPDGHRQGGWLRHDDRTYR